MSPKIIMHVNNCEQGQSIDQICKNAANWGYDGVEFRGKPNGMTIDTETYLNAIEKAAKPYKLQIVFATSGINKYNAPKAEQEQEVETVIRFYEMAAQRFPLSVCNTFAGPVMNPASNVDYFDYTRHGSFIAGQDVWDWAVNSYKILGDTAARLGFKFAFETHMVLLHDTIASAVKLTGLINHPNVGINFDYGNIAYFDASDRPSLREAIATVGDKLYYVHLKNSIRLSTGEQLRTNLADGDINHREYLTLLKNVGYTGYLCIENPRPGDREWFAQNDLAYLRKLIDEVL